MHRQLLAGPLGLKTMWAICGPPMPKALQIGPAGRTPSEQQTRQQVARGFARHHGKTCEAACRVQRAMPRAARLARKSSIIAMSASGFGILSASAGCAPPTVPASCLRGTAACAWPDGSDALGRKTPAAQTPKFIERARRRLALAHHKRRHIRQTARANSRHGVRAQRINWCTTVKPPMITQSPTCTWPASWSCWQRWCGCPPWQSCAM